MRITFHPCDALPDDVAVAIIEGDAELVILLNPAATTEDICQGLNGTLPAHLGTSWLYVGGVA